MQSRNLAPKERRWIVFDRRRAVDLALKALESADSALQAVETASLLAERFSPQADFRAHLSLTLEFATLSANRAKQAYEAARTLADS